MIIARFILIVPTFVPSVAGIGKIPYPRFLAFSSFGSLLWVNICLGAGVLLGEIEFVKKHFEVVILAVTGVAMLPTISEAIKSKTLRSTMARI